MLETFLFALAVKYLHSEHYYFIIMPQRVTVIYTIQTMLLVVWYDEMKNHNKQLSICIYIYYIYSWIDGEEPKSQH